MTEQLASGSTSVEWAAQSELIDLARYPITDLDAVAGKALTERSSCSVDATPYIG